MKLAFSTNAYANFSLIDALRDIKAAGYDAVEVLADVPHAYPARFEIDDVITIRDELRRLQLTVCNVNANCSFGYWNDAPPEPFFEPSLISPNPRHREDRARLIMSTLQFAHDLEAKNVSITSGRMLAAMPPDRAAAQFAESIKPILDEADRLNVNVGIECEPGLFIEYVAELRDWIDRLNHPRLGANLDIGHCQVIGESISDAVQLLAGRIWNFHVEDIPGRKHYHLVPGDGTLDWKAFRDSVRSIDYQRFVTVELYTHTHDPQTAARRSLTFLRKLFE